MKKVFGRKSSVKKEQDLEKRRIEQLDSVLNKVGSKDIKEFEQILAQLKTVADKLELKKLTLKRLEKEIEAREKILATQNSIEDTEKKIEEAREKLANIL